MPSVDVNKLRARYLKLQAADPGMSSAAMASKLGISPTTLRKYRAEWDAKADPVDINAEPERPAVEPPKEEAEEPVPIKHMTIDEVPLVMDHPFTTVAKEIRKRKPKEPKQPKLPREKRFSETNPQAWNLAKNFLPRLQVLIPMLFVCYLALTETMAGNYTFYLDWANTLRLPQIMAVMSDPEHLVDILLSNNGYYIWILVGAVVVIVAFYEFIWKSAFKEYRKKVYMREYAEGRCYWHEGNWWHRTWDRYYRSPPRESTKFYIRTHWWPPLNIFNPRASMLEVTVSKEEPYFVRGNKLVVEEKPIRILTDHNKMVTRDGSYDGVPVPVDEARKELDSRQSELIKGTQKVSTANPHILKRNLEKSGIVASPEFIEEVRKAKEEKAEAGGA